MKTKTFICALLGIVSLASCNKTISEVEYPEGELCSLVVNASSEISVKTTGSKETITANEKLIKTLQVFVFRGDFLDAYQKATTSSVSLTCTAGERRVYAVVNAPDLSSISSKSALEAYLVDLSANTASSLVMIGVANATLPGEETVNIAVNRMVARVVVNKISREFESASLGALKFVVKGIYLSDVAGNGSISGAAAPSKWYNTSNKKDDCPALLSDKPNAEIADKGAYSTTHYFYSMPNKVAQKTKLVVEAQLGDKTFYYPIELPALESNKSYEIANILVKRPGADTPDAPVTSDAITFSVSVNDWITVPIVEQII